MASGTLTIDLDALASNWRALNRASGAAVQTAATVKAGGYGLGAGLVARTLAEAGARAFFVAIAEEGAAVREALGPGPAIYVYGGHMPGDADLLAAADLVPMLNSIEQVTRQFETMPDAPFGLQLDSGMNRLGMEAAEWQAVAPLALPRRPRLIMSHLASSDVPNDPMNREQLAAFSAMVEGCGVPCSLAATGGTLLGAAYHFDMTRPGIGLYGGRPFAEARPVVRLSLPVIQVRDVAEGEIVGYSGTWTAPAPARIATLSGGYADGILRSLSNRTTLWHDDIPCPLVGRVSMDLLTVDVTHLPEVPAALDLIGPHQGIDDLADQAGTIGYEILTALGGRYARQVLGGA
ncbi:alanine racemase [Roseicitreum antarcticum]|uniref:Alanine racemase n=1 Tax=Roseicitreum antarcticum TaxID=564137 RepID=A0A1H3BUM5_9RHOB|nr:alanine racemase [Roseicitreum antarcticum]SDX45603.1 alanine racemase [Roseicitreum antarcticum]